MDNLFSTHPSVENRIRALEAIAAEMQPRASMRVSPIPTVGRRPLSAPGYAARAAAAALIEGVLVGRRPLSELTAEGRALEALAPARAGAGAAAGGRDAAAPGAGRRGDRAA